MIEDYLIEIERPLLAQKLLLDYFEYEVDFTYGIFSGTMARCDADKIMAIIFLLKLITKFMQKQRKIYYRKMCVEKYPLRH